jgi:hypothetical protein
LSIVFLGSLMHSKSSSLQSVQIIPPPLTESYSFIGSIFSSSTSDPTFSDSLFLVTDSSLSSFPKSVPTLHITRIHNSILVLPYPSPVLFPDLLFPITGLHYPITDLHYPGPVSPYPSSALFSLVLTLFFLTTVLFSR